MMLTTKKTTRELPVEKSEILFLYENTYSIPNGDPFTGEQRYDEETKRILVSDVRIKRFIRDHLFDLGYDVFVRNDRSETKEGDADSGAAARFNALEKSMEKATAQEILTSLIDVRLFGGISTKKGKAINLTGPVQFALLNPSLNAVELRMHQNTSVFASSVAKTRGAIGTTTVVPYALNQIHGWINPYAALATNLTEADISRMLSALWDSVNCANTRTKSNQNSLLMVKIIYSEPTKKLYGLDHLIRLRTAESKREEQIRNRDDYSLDISALLSKVKNSAIVREVQYYTEDDILREQFDGANRFRFTTLNQREEVQA